MVEYMNAEYLILTSDYQTAIDYSKELGLEWGQWNWIRDRFKDPIAYIRYIKP
jgi:hypothetical protein